jgi:hypothetical protein
MRHDMPQRRDLRGVVDRDDRHGSYLDVRRGSEMLVTGVGGCRARRASYREACARRQNHRTSQQRRLATAHGGGP